MDIESQTVDITGNSSTNNGEGMREKFEEEAIKRQEMLWRQEEEEEQRRAEAREKARQMRKWKVFVFVKLNTTNTESTELFRPARRSPSHRRRPS